MILWEATLWWNNESWGKCNVVANPRGPQSTAVGLASTQSPGRKGQLWPFNLIRFGVVRMGPSLDLRDKVKPFANSNQFTAPKHAGQLTRQAGGEGRHVI